MVRHSISFNLSDYEQADGTRAIRMFIIWENQVLKYPTSCSCTVDKFDRQRGRCQPMYHTPHTTGAQINTHLTALESCVEDLFAQHSIARTIPSKADIKNALDLFTGKAKAKATEPTDTAQAVLRLFIESEGTDNTWSESTYKKFRTIGRHLHAFNPSLTLSQLDTEGLQSLTRYLRTTAGLRNTTIDKYLRLVRWFLGWAYRKGYTSSRDFDDYRPKLKGTDGNQKEVIYLEWDELMEVWHHEFPRFSPLDRARDVFAFCCFSGLRYSDVRNLRLADVFDDHIRVVTQKTADGINIELNQYTRAILEKYSTFPMADGTHALPVPVNQVYNRDIKEVCRQCGLDRPMHIVYYYGSERREEVKPKWQTVTTHTARRTFVVHCMSLGIAPHIIMKWTGHADIKAMKPYMDITDEKKRESMTLFDNPAGGGQD